MPRPQMQHERDEKLTEISSVETTSSVLFVDDDKAFATRVSDYLEQTRGFEVRVETSIEGALNRLERDEPFNCVVSGYGLSGQDGREFLQACKERFPDLPFVLLAGEDTEQDASHALGLGVDDYLETDTSESSYELLGSRIDSCVTIHRQQQSLQDLHAAMEHAGHAILVTDADGTITYANHSMEEISGYSLEELRGRTPAVLKSGEHGDAFYQSLWETILDGNVWQGEMINEHKSGHRYVVDQTISPITSGDEITGFVAINRDVTVRKRRDRNRAFFEQAVEQIGTGIAAYDETGTIRYANEAYADMLETTPERLTGNSVTELNPHLDAEQFEDYWDSFDIGESRQREGINKCPNNGTSIPVDTVTTQIVVDDDEYHVGTIQDITERKARERELQMFREAVEQAGHAVVVTDADGTIEYVNPAFEEMSGYTREEAMGESPAILSSGEHDQEFYQSLWGTIRDGEVWTGEILNERKDGERYIIDQTIAPLTEDGEITGFVAINRDISELKKRERELHRQNERLEKFGRTVAHDLRNPLNVMEANLDQARRADDPAEAHAEIQAAIDRMMELIDELLALAEQGKTVVDPKPASLNAVTQAAWSNVDTQVMQLAVEADAMLLMDDSRVTQLLENLFRNAREHAGVDATVRVGPLADGFYVEDDGDGIPPEERDDVLKSGFTTSEEGTGFGLAIVSQIADAHDWSVTITDGSDGGARFEFHDVERA